MIINKKTNFLIVCFLIFSKSLKSEFMLYKVDKTQSDGVGLLQFHTLTDVEGQNLINLYKNTIYKYQWPMVLAFYPNFTKTEQADYLQSLKTDRGLYHFIKKMVREKSHNAYDVLWVPTTVFELFTILFFVHNLNDEFLSKIFNNEFVYSEKDLVSLYFKIFDHIIKYYRFNNNIIHEIDTTNEYEILNIVSFLGNAINSSQKTRFGLAGFNQYAIYDDEMLPIIQKYLSLEQRAFNKNLFLLSRGTNGYTYRAEDLFDYKLGTSGGISYAYSLFAGTVFERWYHKISVPAGARSIDYIMRFKIGYVLPINIVDVLNNQNNIKDIFSFPILTTIHGILGVGETFHPRLRHEEISTLSGLEQTKIAKGLAHYLSTAELIKLDKNVMDSELILEEDIKMQNRMLFHKEAQQRLSIEDEEMFDRYEHIFLPMIKEKLSLKSIPSEYIKFLDLDTLKNVTSTQKASLSQDQLAVLTDNQRKALDHVL